MQKMLDLWRRVPLQAKIDTLDEFDIRTYRPDSPVGTYERRSRSFAYHSPQILTEELEKVLFNSDMRILSKSLVYGDHCFTSFVLKTLDGAKEPMASKLETPNCLEERVSSIVGEAPCSETKVASIAVDEVDTDEEISKLYANESVKEFWSRDALDEKQALSWSLSIQYKGAITLPCRASRGVVELQNIGSERCLGASGEGINRGVQVTKSDVETWTPNVMATRAWQSSPLPHSVVAPT
ncbi:hypothetical protein F5887DRAFT_916853 [Amanita rubescens]|nr:hypothetical protein F5887DRAFT_916853 [Amanita rubescens]